MFFTIQERVRRGSEYRAARDRLQAEQASAQVYGQSLGVGDGDMVHSEIVQGRRARTEKQFSFTSQKSACSSALSLDDRFVGDGGWAGAAGNHAIGRASRYLADHDVDDG